MSERRLSEDRGAALRRQDSGDDRSDTRRSRRPRRLGRALPDGTSAGRNLRADAGVSDGRFAPARIYAASAGRSSGILPALRAVTSADRVFTTKPGAFHLLREATSARAGVVTDGRLPRALLQT